MARPVAVISGAGSGIGAAVATRLADRYDLIIAHLDDDLDGATAAAVTGSLTEQATLDSLAAHIAQAEDRLAVLVSNAGAYPRIPWHSLDLEKLRQQIEVNLITHAACAKLVTPAFTARGAAGSSPCRPSSRSLAASTLPATSQPRAAWKVSFAWWPGNSDPTA